MTRLRLSSLPLLTTLVMLPVAVLTVAGLALLRHERERWEERAVTAERQELERAADDVANALRTLRRELTDTLSSLSANRVEDGLLRLRNGHPMVRNVFHVSGEGVRQLPPREIHLGLENERFLRRYASLFDGRTDWFDPRADTAASPANSVQSSLWRGGKFSREPDAASPPALRSRWRPWHWEDRDGILFYVEAPQTGDILGVELEMSALYARLDVLLRDMASPGSPLALLDRRDRRLTVSEEPPDRRADVVVEVGPMLPFARLAFYRDGSAPAVEGGAFFLTTVGMGLLLVLSIVAGTLGLTARVHRSRREAMRKTSFVSNVSHEFKTPLTTLRLYSELLLEGRVSDPQKQTHYLRTLRDESERLARLVHNALDFSRLEMGRSRLDPVALDLVEHAAGVRDRLAERLERARLRITLPDTPVPVRADPDAVEQILLNLFDNALKYAASGGRLDVVAHCRDSRWNVRFRDYGPGIPGREHRHLFKAFHQVDERLNRETGGTGLGLHISRRLARQMRGDLDVEPVHPGVCFVWTLPAHHKEPS